MTKDVIELAKHTELIRQLEASAAVMPSDAAVALAYKAAAAAIKEQAAEVEGLRKDAALVAARERERCAQLCEEDQSEAMEWSGTSCPGNYFAAAIRALNTEGEGNDPITG